MYIYAWKVGSEGASALAEALPAKRIRHENSKFIGGAHKVVINWGSSELPVQVQRSRVINPADRIAICSNKLRFFQYVGDRCSVPEWTTEKVVAIRWLTEKHTICARQVLNGHSAQGLVIMTNDPRTHVDAPLYVKYIPKKDEYRVHVVRGNVIDIQKKVLQRAFAEEHGDDINWKVRNLANGFIYQRENIQTPVVVSQEAINAIAAVQLDFGAVDIVFNNKQNRAYVLEINSAPGIQGTTVQNYANALRNI